MQSQAYQSSIPSLMCVMPPSQGGVFAGRGAHQAFLASTRSLSPPLMAFLKWAPELILGSAAFPSLQVSGSSGQCLAHACMFTLLEAVLLNLMMGTGHA